MPTPPDAAVIRRLALLVPSSFIPAPFESRMACKAVIAATGREHPSIAVTPSGLLAVYLREAIAYSANAPPFYTQNTADQAVGSVFKRSNSKFSKCTSFLYTKKANQADCHTYQLYINYKIALW